MIVGFLSLYCTLKKTHFKAIVVVIWSSINKIELNCQRWSLVTSQCHDGQMARTQAGQTMQFLVTSVPLEESSKFVPSVSKIL